MDILPFLFNICLEKILDWNSVCYAVECVRVSFENDFNDALDEREGVFLFNIIN